jgi:hypothetical protein
VPQYISSYANPQMGEMGALGNQAHATKVTDLAGLCKSKCVHAVPLWCETVEDAARFAEFAMMAKQVFPTLFGHAVLLGRMAEGQASPAVAQAAARAMASMGMAADDVQAHESDDMVAKMVAAYLWATKTNIEITREMATQQPGTLALVVGRTPSGGAVLSAVEVEL